MKKIIFSLAVLFSYFFSYSQAIDTRIGEWNTHLSYSSGLKSVEAKNKIYCQTPNGLFYFNKEDNSITKLSKLDGFSDIDMTTIAYDKANGSLFIAYNSTIIDILKDNIIYSITDIYRKSIPGKKIINDIFFYDNKAYISCSFGIVVYDIIKQEVKETYSGIGSGGKQLEIYSVTINNGNIYAATQDGILNASLSSPNLLDYKSWSLIKTGLATKLTSFHNEIYAYLNNSIVHFNGITWTNYLDTLSGKVKSMESDYNKLVICSSNGVYIVDTLGNITIRSEKTANHAMMDADGNLWYSQTLYSLIKDDGNNTQIFSPNCPWSNQAYAMAFNNKTLWVIQGAIDDSWAPKSLRGSLYYYGYYYNDKLWFNKVGIFNPEFNDYSDFITLAADPITGHLYIGSFGKGLIEYYDDQIRTVYNAHNSTLTNTTAGFDTNTIIISGLAFDHDNNLWICNRGAINQISVKKSDGTWTSYNAGTGVNRNLSKIVIDDLDQKWILLQRESGILVFDEKQPANRNYKKFTTGTGNGNLPNINVYSIAKDLDDKIWIGTDAGVAVFYDPSLVFSDYNSDAQQVWVDEGDNSGYLLATEAVTAIAVDGANKKWLGTKRGLWYVSPDGSKIIYNFNTKNSPLPSDYIRDITIDNKTGEVYFATDKGIVSFRNKATEGGDSYNDVYAYPNPVRPGYSGTIAIRGLVRDANVKITDIAGNIVFETTAEGGQAIWDGKNFSGNPVHSGVYLILTSNEDGSKTYITKLLIVR